MRAMRRQWATAKTAAAARSGTPAPHEPAHGAAAQRALDQKPAWAQRPPKPGRAAVARLQQALLFGLLSPDAAAHRPEQRRPARKTTWVRQHPVSGHRALARQAALPQALLRAQDAAHGQPAPTILPRSESADAGARPDWPTISPRRQTRRLSLRRGLQDGLRECAICPSLLIRGKKAPHPTTFRPERSFPRWKQDCRPLSQIFPHPAHCRVRADTRRIAPLAAGHTRA